MYACMCVYYTTLDSLAALHTHTHTHTTGSRMNSFNEIRRLAIKAMTQDTYQGAEKWARTGTGWFRIRLHKLTCSLFNRIPFKMKLFYPITNKLIVLLLWLVLLGATQALILKF